MAYKIKLGTFKKHENSTAQPVTTSWLEYDVNLKDGADLIRPVLTLNISFNSLAGYNYAYFMNRYYFIVEKRAVRTDLCSVGLKLDVMATYKNDIGATSMYILRASAASDGDIIDNFYATTGKVSYSSVQQAGFSPSSYSSGYYILNVMGIATGGNSTLWRLTPANYRLFISALYSTIDGVQITDVKEALQKLLGGSPEKLVSSAMWVPDFIGSNLAVGTAEEIVVGGWQSGVNGNLITNPVYENVSWINLTLPKHPKAATRGNFLKLAPFSTYTLSIPLFGTINIDTTAIIDSTSINAALSFDAITGQGKCRVTAQGTNAPIIADLTAQIGCAAPLQGQSNGNAVIGSIASTIAGLTTAGVAMASGGVGAAAFGAIGAGIGSGASAIYGASCSMGSTGNILAARLVPTLNCTFLDIVDEDNTNNGRPYCKVATPSALTGYIQAYKSMVEIDGTLEEQEEIAGYIENGFYYE